MDTQLKTPTSTFVYQHIPTKVCRKDFNRYIDPYLKKPKKGPKPKLSLYSDVPTGTREHQFLMAYSHP